MDTLLYSDLADYHLTFELRERRSHALFTDQLAVHILELPKFNKSVDQLVTPLDRWLYFLGHAQELDADALPETLDVEEVRWALGDLIMITQSEPDRERYESRLKMQRDVYTAIAEAREGGRAEGQIARIQSFQRLLRQQITPPEDLHALSFADRENLADRLEAELNRKLANG